LSEGLFFLKWNIEKYQTVLKLKFDFIIVPVISSIWLWLTIVSHKIEGVKMILSYTYQRSESQ